jgi:hypothetical protein
MTHSLVTLAPVLRRALRVLSADSPTRARPETRLSRESGLRRGRGRPVRGHPQDVLKPVLLTLALVWLPVQAAAQKPTLDSRIDVRLEAMPAADAFRQIISGLGYELQMDATIDAPVTLWVTHISARTALNVLCESLGCQWRMNGTRLVVSKAGAVVAVGVTGKTGAERAKVVATDVLANLRKPLPVDMQFKDVPVSTVLRAMSEVSGIEITTDEPLASRHITLSEGAKTVEDALKAIVDEAGGYNLEGTVFRMQATGGEPRKMLIKIKPRPVKK